MSNVRLNGNFFGTRLKYTNAAKTIVISILTLANIAHDGEMFFMTSQLLENCRACGINTMVAIKRTTIWKIELFFRRNRCLGLAGALFIITCAYFTLFFRKVACDTITVIHMSQNQLSSQPIKQPMSGAKHFWLSFLAVVTGVPVSLMILFGGSIIMTIFFFMLIAASIGGSTQPTENSLVYTSEFGSSDALHTLVSVPVHGVILSGSAADPLQTLFGASFADGEAIKKQLRTLAEDPDVDGVVLEVDSPGGMITASKAIADGIEYYKQTAKKPIITHINGMGASGGYWVSAATDAIYAEQGSEAGSIGVILGPLATLKGIVGYGDIATTEPIQFKYFTAGRSKDLGSPFRDITPEEDAYLNAQIQAEYEKFVTHVATSRDITPESIRGEIGALSYGTNDAIRLKLIDGEMSSEQAYAELAERAGVADDYKVLRVDNTVDFFGSLFGVRQLISSFRMSETDKSAGRMRFCETNLVSRPLILDGDPSSICK